MNIYHTYYTDDTGIEWRQADIYAYDFEDAEDKCQQFIDAMLLPPGTRVEGELVEEFEYGG